MVPKWYHWSEMNPYLTTDIVVRSRALTELRSPCRSMFHCLVCPGFHPADVFETEARAEKGMGDEIARMSGRMYYLHVYVPKCCCSVWRPMQLLRVVLELFLWIQAKECLFNNKKAHRLTKKNGRKTWYALHILSQVHKTHRICPNLTDLHGWHTAGAPQFPAIPPFWRHNAAAFRHAFVWAFSYVRLVRGDMANSDCFDACGTGIRLFTSRWGFSPIANFPHWFANKGDRFLSGEWYVFLAACPGNP